MVGGRAGIMVMVTVRYRLGTVVEMGWDSSFGRFQRSIIIRCKGKGHGEV